MTVSRSQPNNEQLQAFLNLVPSARWRSGKVPKVWNDQLRQSLSDNLVAIGFGGVVMLTDAGYAALQPKAQS